MATLSQLLKRKVSDEAFDIQLGQGICFGGGVFVLGVGTWKIGTFALSPFQILGGLLLLATVSLLIILMSLVLPLACAAAKRKDK